MQENGLRKLLLQELTKIPNLIVQWAKDPLTKVIIIIIGVVLLIQMLGGEFSAPTYERIISYIPPFLVGVLTGIIYKRL